MAAAGGGVGGGGQVALVQNPLHFWDEQTGGDPTQNFDTCEDGTEMRVFTVELSNTSGDNKRKTATFWITADKSTKVALEFIEAFAQQTESWTQQQLNDYLDAGHGNDLYFTTEYDENRPHEEGHVYIYHPTRDGNSLESAFYLERNWNSQQMSWKYIHRKGIADHIDLDRYTLDWIKQHQPRNGRRQGVGGQGQHNVPGPVGAHGVAAVQDHLHAGHGIAVGMPNGCLQGVPSPQHHQGGGGGGRAGGGGGSLGTSLDSNED